MNEAFFYNSVNIALKSDYKRLKILRSRFSSWKDIWDNLSKSERDSVNPDKEWEKVGNSGARLILIEEKAYPGLLKEIDWPPFGLYVLGDLPHEDGLTLSVVGTRKATDEGKELANDFSFELSGRGFTIISGLALGVDAAAHKGALRSGGKTIAVLANGLNSIYPRSNERLGREILSSGGALVSEYPVSSPVLPYRFLERNRIVSGLSRGTLVIEAPKDSGSLVTARFAMEQNREVFVIPGPVKHPNFFGSHLLIKKGAAIATKPDDILEVLAPNLLTENLTRQKDIIASTDEERIVMNVLEKAQKPVTVDKIIELTNLKPKNVNQALAFLTIKGIVRESGNGYTV